MHRARAPTIKLRTAALYSCFAGASTLSATDSAGLALVFLFFILAETLLKHTQGQEHANADLFFIVINAPMDLFLLTTSIASVILFLSLRQLRRQLRMRREQIRELAWLCLLPPR